MILENLYDISSLSEIDNDSKSVIITDEQAITSIFSGDLNDRMIAAQIFRNEMNKTLKTGDVVLVTNEDFTIKAYCLITIVCGQIVPYLLYFLDYNEGKEITRNFTKGDIDILSQYPMFAEDEQLVFFITQLNKVFSADAPSDNRKYFQIIKTYLDKGLWAGNIDSLYGSTKEIADKLNYRSIDEDANVLFEKDGQILAFYGYNIYGNYEDVRKAYCEVAMMKENESLIYNSFFGNLFLTDAGSGIVNRNLLKYEEDVNNFFKKKPIQKTEEEVISQTIENTEAKITASENSFLADMDKLFQEAEEKIEKEKKKKNIENFKIQAEISEEEKYLAIKETITKAEKKITVPVVNQTQKFNQEVKIKDAIFNSPQDTYPKDWDYVYSVGETSRRYNPTIGQKYDSLTDTFIQDISQTKGMSIEEWNAYFIAHPEISHLIDETIGHLGGLFLDKKDLMEGGYLLYDPKNVRLVYRHEYIRGNVYKLIDELENVKDVVIKVYGEKFYDNQIEILKSSIPPMRTLSSGDSSSIPFIHPLDEVIVDYKVNTAAGITYKNDSNNKELKKYRKELEDMVVNKTIQPNEVNAMLDEFSAKVQVLPLTVFFVEWLKTKYGKIAEYGLSSYELVFELYFKGLSHPGYAKHLVAANLVIVPPGKKPVDVVSVSDYFEAKDNAKRFVNDMFQQFIADEITNEDKKQIEILWNKRYNGYYTPDYWKLPVFIRHSKYFKNRNNKRLLNLNETQIMGIKFATIENSSIMAHEVGYGKMQPLDSKLLTPNGWITMGDVKVGDEVISVDGKPTKVLGIFPHGKKDIYKVTFDDGSSTECGEEHLWTYKSIHHRNPDKKTASDKGWNLDTGWQTATLRELMDKGIKNKRGNKRFNIPIVEPVHFDKKILPIHPYLLGVLIGDGNFGFKGYIGLTSADDEIIDRVKLLLPDSKLEIKQINSTNRKKYEYTISKSKRSSKPNDLSIHIEKLGLRGKKSDNKFIPEIYKFTSVEDRISLLQGLMDTDGTTKTIKNSSQLSYTTTSEKLRDDVIFLVQSLGGIATVYSRIPTYVYKGEKKKGKLAHTININIPNYIQPFLLTRKIEKYIPKTKYQPSRFITSVEFIGQKEAQCIKVEHESHLYVTDEFIVTHNTLVAIGYISHCFETRQSSNFMIAIPKTLFDNKKWREEIYGNYDDKKGIYIVGATPVYNLIELGNCSTSSIYGGGKNSEYKTYSDDDIDKINNISRIFVEIGGRESDKKTSKSVGTATIPKNPYNYKLAVVNSNYAWSKIIDKILPGIDQALFNKSRGKDYDENKEIIDLLVNYDFNAPIVNQDGSTSPADKKWHIWNLGNQILKTRFKYQYLFKQIGYNNSIDVDATISADPKSEIARRFDLFKNSELPDKYKRDKDGKLILDKATGERKEKPFSEIYEDYLMFVFEDLHQYISTVIQRMVDFAIYEYGNWKFSTSDRNIVLITKDALQNIGFSSDEIDGVKAIVEEITKYKNEERLSDAVNYYVNTGNGGVQKFSRRPEKVLQKQLEEMMDKINLNMTEQGKRGKFFLSNLKIDGFILDEAHIAKKLFTNVKTDARVELELPNGDVVSVRTSSHDINGGTPPNTSLFVFAVCQYIRSLGNRKPLMLLTATPFSNQPTEIFSMLSIVGINQLRENGVSNIKNFFDLFLKETLKYDFNQNGEFIKRITVEDFRNKEMLLNLIWSVIDIRREASLDKLEKAEKRFGDKPIKIAFPKLVSDTAVQKSNVSADDEDLILDECEQVGSVNTVAILNRVNNNTCSIVDQNSIQKKMFSDIEKVVSRELNPKTNLEYTFDDICPNVSIFKELESQEKKEKTRKKSIEEDEAETKNNILVTLRSLVNSNINEISNGYNFDTDEDFYYYIKNIKDPLNPNPYYSKYPKFEDLKFDTLFFIKNSNLTDSISGMRQWEIFKKSSKAKSTTIKVGNNYYGNLLVEFISSEEMAKETIRQLSRNNEYGITFKALGISKAIALSPYFYSCNDLPYPTPENIVKYSPKIEYLVKAIKSVKDHHINEIPKLIEDRKKTLENLMKIKTPTNLDLKQIEKLRVEIPQLEAAREVSGQVIYINNMRFKYYFKDKDGKVKVEDFNIAELIIQYLVDKGWYSKDEVVLVSSGTGDEKKEKYIKEFQQGKVKVLFGTPAIKEGVDLQNKATTLYVLTPDWNPTDMRQVEGRIWRRDNENKFIRVVYILLDQSIEVFIYSKLEEKANRLKKIMKERGTIDEFEEMSLNPNQTKVALASDPKKRADIITKLCKVVLEEQKNKINKNRQELIQIDNTLSTIVDNIEIIKNNYFEPYYTEMPNILDKYYNFVIKDQAELFANKKDLFLERFVNRYHEYNQDISGTYLIKSNDVVLRYAMGLIYSRPTTEKLRYPYWTYDMNEVYDIFNGLEIILNKREDILMEIENTSDNSFHIIKKEMVLRYSPESSDINIMRFLAVDNRIKNTDKFFFTSSIESFISAAGILYLMPENILDEFKIVMKVILDKMKSGNITKQEIVNELDNFIILAKEMYIDYILNNPYFKLENYPPYQEAKTKRDKLKNNTKFEDLDAADIIDKMKTIRDFWFEDLSPKLNSFSTLPVETKRDIIAGNNKIPYLTEILVKLDLVSNKSEELVKKRSEIYALFDPILQTISTFQDVSLNLKNTKGMTLSDIPKVLSETQDKYDEIETKMIKLEKIKEKLIEKFEKINNEKKNVTVDDIVKKFAETNEYLNYKLQ